MQPGLAVVAEAEPVGRAGGDRDDVLERAAQLDAEHVAVDVEPEPPPTRAARCTRSASARSAAATTADAGRLRAISAARFGPDRAAIRDGLDAAGLGDDLGSCGGASRARAP